MQDEKLVLMKLQDNYESAPDRKVQELNFDSRKQSA
jgi:hypothetical protein